jgi:hypothetical protein
MQLSKDVSVVEAQPGQATPVHIFYSYADEDQAWLKQLHDHMASLRRSKAITDWHRGMPSGRAEWEAMIDQHLKQPAVVLPLISAVYLNTVQQLWGATGGLDAAATAALCQRLHATSLLLDFNPTRRTIRLHDVIRTYLRAEASMELPALSARFLAAYSLASWADLPNEPYLWEHLAYHLFEVGRIAELVTTVKDLRYLARKTLLKKTFAVENDLLQAEQQAPTDATLHLLKRSYIQMSHLLNQCGNYAEVATVLHSRMLHLDDLAAACRQLELSLRRPYLTSWHLLPDLPDPALIRTLRGHTSLVTTCAVSPQGNWIVSASDDGALKIWDAHTGAELRSLRGHTDQVNACAVSPDGTWLVSASEDKTLKMWDARTGARLTTLHVGGALRGCAFCPDGEHLVAVGKRGSVFFARGAVGNRGGVSCRIAARGADS